MGAAAAMRRAVATARQLRVQAGARLAHPRRGFESTARAPPCGGDVRREELRAAVAVRSQTHHVTEEGVRAAVLGAQSPTGQYLALLLKQSPCFTKLCLFDSRTAADLRAGVPHVGAHACGGVTCACRDLRVVNTRCRVEAFRACAGPDELDRCVQSCRLVVLVEPGGALDVPERYALVRRYAAAVSRQCPETTLLVDVWPVDGCVPVAVETMRERYDVDPRRVLGAVALPEARARAAVSRALALAGVCVRVPCVGGADTDTAVPLFSNAVDNFGLGEGEAERLTTCLRRARGPALLSRAHALAVLAARVARALLRGRADSTSVSAYLLNDCGQLMTPVRYVARPAQLGADGLACGGAWPRMSRLERRLVAAALEGVAARVAQAEVWCDAAREAEAVHAAAQLTPLCAPGGAARARLEHCAPMPPPPAPEPAYFKL